MNATETSALSESLDRLRHGIPAVCQILKRGERSHPDTWVRIVEQRLLPRLDPDFPLTVAICGGGSAGKSTLFNALAGDSLSPVGGRAGLNRRVLVALHPQHVTSPERLAALLRPFGVAAEPLVDSGQLIEPGAPLYISTPQIPPQLVLLDTPDFDTGARGVYANRHMAREALEAADLFIYIFTNSNYNNRDNTDFIARMLTGIGRRRCFLVYRAYPSFSPEEVRSHAATVARNIYGDDADQFVMGVYRCDEDNAVAAGQATPRLEAMGADHPPFALALSQLDPRPLRLALMDSVLRDVIATAAEIRKQAQRSLAHLKLYADALRATQSRCVQMATQQFPMDLVLKRFAQIWVAGDPMAVRFMRGTGRVLDLPFRALTRAFRWARGSDDKPSRETSSAAHFAEVAEADLTAAVNQLYRQAIGPEITVNLLATDPVARRMLSAVKQATQGREDDDPAVPSAQIESGDGEAIFRVPVHPALAAAGRDLQQREWQPLLVALTDRRQELVALSAVVEADLQELAQHLRRQMGWRGQVKQAFSALLNVIPATAAVTYILSTGDPMGAVGIKVKLAGLFGLHDLYALVALPVTSGLKQADESQLKQMLSPLAQSWLNDKLQTVQALFETHLTGDILAAADQAVAEAETHLAAIDEDIDQCLKTLR